MRRGGGAEPRAAGTGLAAVMWDGVRRSTAQWADPGPAQAGQAEVSVRSPARWAWQVGKQVWISEDGTEESVGGLSAYPWQ